MYFHAINRMSNNGSAAGAGGQMPLNNLLNNPFGANGTVPALGPQNAYAGSGLNYPAGLPASGAGPGLNYQPAGANGSYLPPNDPYALPPTAAEEEGPVAEPVESAELSNNKNNERNQKGGRNRKAPNRKNRKTANRKNRKSNRKTPNRKTPNRKTPNRKSSRRNRYY